MKEILVRKLKEVTSEVLETMFYLVPEDLEGGSPGGEGEYVVEIPIEGGGTKAAIYLSFSSNLAEQMAANFLAEGEVSQPMIIDVLKEAANMMGGNLVSALDKKGEWKLGQPQVYQGVEAYGMVIGLEPVCEFDVDGEILRVYAAGRRGG